MLDEITYDSETKIQNGFFQFVQFWFFPNEWPGLCQNKLGHSLLKMNNCTSNEWWFLFKKSHKNWRFLFFIHFHIFFILGVPGGWSVWSSWSSCSPECFQHRRRTCTNPEPSKRGSYCDGIDLQSKNCTHGFCQGKIIFLKDWKEKSYLSSSTTVPWKCKNCAVINVVVL